MGRAERRRQAREGERRRTATYNLTQEQLDAMVRERIAKDIEEAKREATDEAVNTAMVLLLGIPAKVLMEDYWKRSARRRMPGFMARVVECYRQWQDGEVTLEEISELLWEVGGVRIAESRDGAGEG